MTGFWTIIGLWAAVWFVVSCFANGDLSQYGPADRLAGGILSGMVVFFMTAISSAATFWLMIHLGMNL